MRRLIINADDFGLTGGVNRGIVEAHRRGLVTSTTLMANAAGFDDAVQLARQTPSLDVGCHIVLMDGEPILDPEEVSTLMAPGSRGRFRDDFTAFAAAVMRGRMVSHEIEHEAAAQIRKIQQAGVTVTHVDTHKHAHMFPGVLAALLRAARGCSVPAIRNPFAPIKPLAFAHLARRPRLWTRYSEVRVLRRLGAGFRRSVAEAGMVTTDGSFGVVSTGALDAALFEAIVGCIPEGTWEFVCHPGHNDADLDRVRTRLRASRELELGVLISEAARKAIKQRGIELAPYAAIASAGVPR